MQESDVQYGKDGKSKLEALEQVRLNAKGNIEIL